LLIIAIVFSTLHLQVHCLQMLFS